MKEKVTQDPSDKAKGMVTDSPMDLGGIWGSL